MHIYVIHIPNDIISPIAPPAVVGETSTGGISMDRSHKFSSIPRFHVPTPPPLPPPPPPPIPPNHEQLFPFHVGRKPCDRASLNIRRSARIVTAPQPTPRSGMPTIHLFTNPSARVFLHFYLVYCVLYDFMGMGNHSCLLFRTCQPFCKCD